MKKSYVLIIAMFLLPHCARSQDLFDRLPVRTKGTAVLIGSYTGNMQIVGFGTGAFYNVPTSTNAEGSCISSIVTAKHILFDSETGALCDGLLVKINMPDTSQAHCIKVPLIHDAETNFWTSPSGLDLAVVPLPNNLLENAEIVPFRENQIATPKRIKELEINAGQTIKSECIQSELLDLSDFLSPEVLPIIRIGHLSRIGYGRPAETNLVVRPHVIDLHSSPGNSGATVVLFAPRKDSKGVFPVFLGIEQGFVESSYAESQVHRKNTPSKGTILISMDNKTNAIPILKRNIANPNLTFVTPVYELEDLRSSPTFVASTVCMTKNSEKYKIAVVTSLTQ